MNVKIQIMDSDLSHIRHIQAKMKLADFQCDKNVYRPYIILYYLAYICVDNAKGSHSMLF